MNYYAHYNTQGKLLYKEATEILCNAQELTEEEYNALDVEAQQEIFELKRELAATDYIACKIAEGAATREDYAAELQLRQALRNRINELSGEA